MEDDNWDLQAVVRGCSSAVSSTTTTTATTTPTWSTFQPLQGDHFLGFPDLFEPSNENSIEHLLNDLYNPLIFPKPHKTHLSPQILPISPLSVLGELQDLSHQQQQQHHHQQQQQRQVQAQQQTFGVSRSTTSHAQSTRPKKRKNQMKRVCQVPTEGLSSDMWSWRKYGQKPIKGSPYPRGYYRCSTSKGCLARKQVERNRSDPNMFIVTYTGEHNHPLPTHRNSLAGSTRQKPVNSGDNGNKPTSSSPVSPSASLSPAKTEEREDTVEEEDDDDDNVGISDLEIGDDFFDGLDELVAPAIGYCFSDNFPASLPFPVGVD